MSNLKCNAFFLWSFLKCLDLECSNFFTFLWMFWLSKVKKPVKILITFCYCWNCRPYFRIYDGLENFLPSASLPSTIPLKWTKRYWFPPEQFIVIIHTNHVRLSSSLYHNYFNHQHYISKHLWQIWKHLIVSWQKKTLR